MNKKEEEKNPYISILLYGKAGTGKSIFASTFPNALVIDADGGHRLYESHFGHTYVRGGTCIRALERAVQQLKEGTFKYDTIVIDSLTNIENLAVANAKGMNSGNWVNSLYTGKGKKLGYDDWGQISGSTIALFTYLRELPVNLVVITQIETTHNGGTEVYKPNLVGKGSDEGLHFSDIVGFMTKENENEGTARYLHLSSTSQDNFIAKMRNVSGDVKPIRNPNYEKLIEVIKSQKFNLNFED